tara:strand:- start:3634 stop:4611 length:978 start_codon:yes stop_codon:yes gene_type:complete
MKNEVILFWSLYDRSLHTNHNDWKNTRIVLDPLHVLALHSHIKLKNNVTIYTYQDLDKKYIPKDIVVKDASDIFSSEIVYNSLNKGHSIAHVSDAVRLKVASRCKGIVLDMDAVMIRQFPKEESWFCSMPAKLTGGMAPKWKDKHPPLKVHDNSWDGKALASFPVKVGEKTSKYIEALSHKIMRTLIRPPKKSSKAWNYVLWTLKEIIHVDKNAKVYEPIYFCALPAWLNKGNCYSIEYPTRLDGQNKLFGYKLPSIKECFDRAYMVQHFFDSAAHKQGGYGVISEDKNKGSRNFWHELPEQCLLAKEAEYVLGENWREIIIKTI